MSGATPPAPAAPSAAGHAAGPQRYGRYILVDRLGAGGMAEVFRALVVGPEQFQRVVVVKRILPHLSADPNFVRMFIAEATICGRLNHPNIIHVHEFGKVEDHHFIAMEYVQGRTLNSILARLASKGGYMPVTIAAEIARQACLGLAYAHALTGADGRPLGVVHRDVTPSNVMVAYAGGVKVLDFGIARVAGEIRAGDTDAGKVKGKSSYLAPEQILPNGTMDGRVDVFATGIILHEALCCRRLFKAGAPVDTMRLIRELEIPQPSSINADVPAALDDIVMRALARDPDERWQTASEMADALEAFLIERRFASQELPRWLRALFAQDLVAEVDVTLSPQQIEALMEASPASWATSGGLPSALGNAPRFTPASTTMVFSEGETPSVSPPRQELSVVSGGRGEGRDDAQPRNPRRSERRSRLLVLGTLALLVIGFGAHRLLGRRRAEAERAPSGATSAAGTVAAAGSTAPDRASERRSESPASTGSSAPAAAQRVASIAISSQPSGAEITNVATGSRVGTTPVALELPRGATPVELRAVKGGHQAALVTVVPDTDKPLLITLVKEPKVRKAKPRSQGKIRNAVPLDPFAP